MRRILNIIDSISEWTGKAGRWFCLALILVIVNEVVLRYVFNAPTMWGYETAAMIGGAIYALGWAYVHRHRGHIRVDVFYGRLPPRGKAIIDVIGALLLYFPLFTLLLYIAVARAWRAWLISERSVETYWYPPIAPFRTMVAIGLFLFMIQGVAQFVRDLYLLVRGKQYD